MQNRTRLMLGRLLLMSAAVFAVFSASALAQEVDSTAVPDDPLLEPGALDKPPIPELSKEERTDAIALATSENLAVAQAAAIPSLLSGKEYAVEKVGVWHTSTDLKKIGASVVIRLEKPMTLSAKLPVVDYDESEHVFPPYQATTNQVEYTKVERLIVMVDLNSRQVVGITPGPKAIRAAQN